MIKNTAITRLHADPTEKLILPMVGNLFGYLTVRSRAPSRSGKVYWLCVCRCGAEYEAEGYALRSGHTTHCGCSTIRRAAAATTHGMTGTRVYSTWKNMLRRCELPTLPDYANYGGRGIRVCIRWHSFSNFYKDMGDPSEGCSLDRIDNDGPYSPSNCRWATRRQQGLNKRNTLRVPSRGGMVPLAVLAERAGVPYKKVWGRIHRDGWTVEEALCV